MQLEFARAYVWNGRVYFLLVSPDKRGAFSFREASCPGVRVFLRRTIPKNPKKSDDVVRNLACIFARKRALGIGLPCCKSLVEEVH